MEKSNEVVDYYPTISAQEIKPTSKETNNQTNEKKKQWNPLNLTVSCEKRSCLIRRKKKKVKSKTQKNPEKQKIK